MRRLRAHAAGLMLAACFLLPGCTEADTDAFVRTAMEVYDSVGSSSVDIGKDSWYYPYRHDFWHGAYAGECSVTVGSGIPAFSARDISGTVLYTQPVMVTGPGGRAESVFTVLGQETASPGAFPVDGFLVPGLERNRSYVGIVDGDVFRAVAGSPAGNGPCFLATCYAWKAGLSVLYGEAAAYAEGHEGARILCRVTAVYDGRNLMPEGFLFEAYALDGGLSRCMYVYNVQPGIAFDYATGENWIEAAGLPDNG